jgi:hypothetical protein
MINSPRFCQVGWASWFGAVLLGLCIVTPAPSLHAAECLAPKKQNQLEAVPKCTNAMCCPRELNRQVNLVRAVAQKLKNLGYTISAPAEPPENSPDISGMYYSTLRLAVGQYKHDHNIADGNTDLTYDFVVQVLGTNLFERWQ